MGSASTNVIIHVAIYDESLSRNFPKRIGNAPMAGKGMAVFSPSMNGDYGAIALSIPAPSSTIPSVPTLREAYGSFVMGPISRPVAPTTKGGMADKIDEMDG